MLGIVAALANEAVCLTPRQPAPGVVTTLGDNALLAVCGMGADAAAACSGELLARGATALLSWGTAGALSAGLSPGTLLLPREVTDGRTTLTTQGSWHKRLEQRLDPSLAFSTERLLSTVEVIATAEEKAQLAARTGAAAVDMESYAIANCAASAAVPFMALRVIVDPADFTLPKTAFECVDQFGRPQWWPLIRGLLSRPGELPELFALGQCFKRASASLRRVADLLAPDFGWRVP